MSSPLVIAVGELRKRAATRREVHVDAVLDGLALSSSAVPQQPVHVDLVLESVGESVVAVGSVEAPWASECRRCLRAVTGTLRTEVREVFERHPVEGETYPMLDDHIDLEPMVRDAVLLALPLAPLCEDGCRGPDPEDFPVVGPDESRPDPRWAALDDLRFE